LLDQLAEGFLLDLAHPLAGDTEAPADFHESERRLAIEPIAIGQDFLFARFEGRDPSQELIAQLRFFEVSLGWSVGIRRLVRGPVGLRIDA
jgi:hypothetical protein